MMDDKIIEEEVLTAHIKNENEQETSEHIIRDGEFDF